MGFGHRVYKNFDPRAKIIKVAADEVLGQLGIEDPVLDIAKGLEKEALEDQYFVDRKLYPNVDFYSGIIYRALRYSCRNVHSDVCIRASSRVDCTMERNAGKQRTYR